MSSTAGDEMPELIVSKALRAITGSCDFQTVDDHFLVQGPNGCHQVLVSAFAGPSILAITNCPGRITGSRRLRGDLARKVAKQTTMAIMRMHLAGIVHGDLTSSNILFRVAEPVFDWTDDEVYAHLGRPRFDEVKTIDGSPRGPHAPAHLFDSVNLSRLADLSLLQERIILIDFGQSYVISDPPRDYRPATAIHYKPPEMRFEGRTGPEADVWALACAIYEIRAGCSLFESFMADNATVMREIVTMLGRLPDPWWRSFEPRTEWFEEDGEPKDPDLKISIPELVSFIGTEDEPPSMDEGPMIEKCGVRPSEEEVELLSDLLLRMLKYRPEERATMEEVLEHRWFKL
ncbi:kinase-like protein [Punctularia strigosozonata HHB-11173 SS5]|uniref:kinase-like protein n=1 Tax=Punctularia strigosozonata (strain HHB-11173) TaxID=741275 RepID=UPI0004416B83|nr:kinase-like protein [Punctularia strigosozonata HHB-11173 SS5]EIN11906.1 kinase-like protein [Punctularia strigosozonata HHB-11173 SS5]